MWCEIGMQSVDGGRFCRSRITTPCLLLLLSPLVVVVVLGVMAVFVWEETLSSALHERLESEWGVSEEPSPVPASVTVPLSLCLPLCHVGE